MLTAKVCVQYEGDWTAELERYGVFAEVLASTFRDRRYIGIMALETDDLDPAVEVVESHRMIDSVEVLERYDQPRSERTSATLLLEGDLVEFTPLQTLMYEGFLPLGPTELADGRECFDLLLSNRDELSDAVDLLSEFGPVSVDRISPDFRREVVPSHAEWQELLSSIPPRQRDILNTAVELGYFEIPREVTLEELAEELEITKTTASTHLRKAEGQLIEFLVPYINLAVSGEG